MKGWAMVAQDGIAEDDCLARYAELAIGFVKTLPAK